MLVFTYSEARQHFSTILNKACKEGAVKIKRKDGQEFILKPETKNKSSLDVEGIDAGLGPKEILYFIREGRKNYPE